MKKRNPEPVFAGNVLYSGERDMLKLKLDRILSAMGLAMNAGGLAVGSEAVITAIERKKARLVFLTDDISANTREKLISKLVLSETKYIVLPCGMALVAERLGKSGLVSSAALIRPGFEKIIFKCMAEANTVKSLDNTTEVQ